MKIRSHALAHTLHKGETITHPCYFAAVAIFGHGPYAILAGLLAVITILMLFIEE